ncbi:hypothetical protein AGMMS49531_04830 [Endomicrobiia bacterium]|nr:hypothetical protein AGMMS49531_04830 [Endomicrobiia bacterium]
MKKLILVVAMMFVLEGVVFSDFTGEFNVKGGLGAYGNVSLKEKIKINGDNDQEKKREYLCGHQW